jgi:hypothetical protein
MGYEKGVLVGREQNGEYRYELTHVLNEDDQDVGFGKTIELTSPQQGEKSTPLVLKAGKCYMGSFEIPFKFSCVDESNEKALFAYENQAKVSFISEEKNLQIKFNGKIVVENGKALSNLDYIRVEVVKDKENPELTIYDLIFDLSKDIAKTSQFKNPTFTLRSSFPTSLDIGLREGAELKVKTMFKYRVLLQLVETVIKTEKVLTSASMQLMANAEQATENRKFVAAKGFYQQALDSLTNIDDAVTRVSLEENIAHLTDCIEWDKKAAKYMQYIKHLKKTGTTDKMTNIEDAFRQALICYTNLDRLHPAPVYKTFISKINETLETFNFIVIEGTVRDRKDNTKIVAGAVDIYAVNSSNFSKDMRKKEHGEHIGSVGPDGKFRVQIEKNTHKGLLFVPSSDNKDYDKNGFVSLHEQKHLKTTIYLYD